MKYDEETFFKKISFFRKQIAKVFQFEKSSKKVRKKFEKNSKTVQKKFEKAFDEKVNFEVKKSVIK
jgi:hypothetical protein